MLPLLVDRPSPPPNFSQSLDISDLHHLFSHSNLLTNLQFISTFFLYCHLLDAVPQTVSFYSSIFGPPPASLCPLLLISTAWFKLHSAAHLQKLSNSLTQNPPRPSLREHSPPPPVFIEVLDCLSSHGNA